MASPKSTVLSKRLSDSALMPPPPPPKRIKRPSKVLDEDVYSNALSHIIARDFFPGLLETEAQQQYLQALDSHDNEWIREAGRKLTEVMTPVPGGRRRAGRGTSFTPRQRSFTADTPRGYPENTPARTPSTSMQDYLVPEQNSDVDTNMSLGAFQARYTSEDNESFNALLDKQNSRKGSKYAFFHRGNKIPSARQITYRAGEETSGNAVTPSTASVTTNAVGEVRTAVASNGPSEDLDARLASIDSFPNREGPRNHFMFQPEGVEDTVVTHTQVAELKSNAPPKSVTYSATRFQTSMNDSPDTVPPSPSMSAVDAAIVGRALPSQSEAGYTGAETPRINGYAFVDAEPTPSELGLPVSDEDADAVERAATMQLLPKADDDGPNPFKIREISKREGLHERLVEKGDLARRKEKGVGRLEQLRSLGVTPGRTPTPRFSSAPKSVMTPAARRLADRISKPNGKRGSFTSGDAPESMNWTSTRIKKKI